MTQLEILNLACSAAREMWVHSKDRLEKNPDNSIFQHREEENWKRLIELEMLWNAERCKA